MIKRYRFNVFAALGTASLALPLVALAATNVQGVIGIGLDIVNLFIAFLIAAATVVFFYGMVRFIWAAGGEAKAAGKQFILWGILSLFVMVCIWGLVYLLQNTFLEGANLGAPDPNRIIPGGSAINGDGFSPSVASADHYPRS